VWERGPKISKISTFGRVASQGRTPWPISKILWDFTRPTILHLHFKFDLIRFTGYEVITEKLRYAHRSFRPNFSVHPVGKTMRWIEKWSAPFLMVSTSSIIMQSLQIVQRAPAVAAKIWRLSLCLYWQDAAKQQTAGIKFTHRPKIRFFTP